MLALLYSVRLHRRHFPRDWRAPLSMRCMNLEWFSQQNLIWIDRLLLTFEIEDYYDEFSVNENGEVRNSYEIFCFCIC